MAKKEIKDMTLEEMRAEIKEFCRSKQCSNCPLSLYNSDGAGFSHDRIMEIMDYYKLALMLEIVRGNLIWKDQTVTTETVTTETVTTETVLKEACGVNELEVDDDSTGVVIIGKRPSMMTIYFTQPAD